jgi:hypothetical protein
MIPSAIEIFVAVAVSAKSKPVRSGIPELILVVTAPVDAFLVAI